MYYTKNILIIKWNNDKLALVIAVVTRGAIVWEWCTLGCKEGIEMVFFLFKVWYKFIVD